MSAMLDAFFRSWPLDFWVVAPLVVSALVYVRGWFRLHRRDDRRWRSAQLITFLLGLLAVFLALASPIESFAPLFLQAHMVQHVLLMMVAPPLIWLGAPFFPFLRGMPMEVRAYWVAPLLRWWLLRRAFQWLTHPVPAWILFTSMTWMWHIPSLYELALGSDGWHYVQHACLFLAAVVFWHPVIRPYPSRPTWSRWLLIPYLLLADVQNTVLAALLTFANVPLYRTYAELPRLGNISALDDQSAAGVIMWVPGSMAYLIPLFWIGVHLLYGRSKPTSVARTRISLPLVEVSPKSPVDVLRVPIVGRFLQWRHARIVLQLVSALIAIAVIYDGLAGPPVGATNLAGVVPWIHWRGMVVFGLLAAGNIFCMGCPFLLPRTIARRWLPARRAWPRPLRNKMPAVLLLVVFFWAYEALALWDSPWWTAWIAIGYFAAPLIIDGIYRGAPFCKYVCPIGQFHFVNSMVSPLEVKVRDEAVCSSCLSKDCIRGRDGIPGCELHLFQPRKVGNLDCTFCLDCVHACPEDNIGIVPGIPAAELWQDRPRSGIGRLGGRPDVAVLALLLVFAAFTNAAGMTAPVFEWQDSVTAAAGWTTLVVATTIFHIGGLVLLPTVLIAAAAMTSNTQLKTTQSVLHNALTYSYCLIPLGFGMWLAHYSFHFLTSFGTLWPAGQRFLADMGYALLGEPDWIAACCIPVSAALLRLEILFLELGMLLSLYSGHRITQSAKYPMRAYVPWGVLIVVLFAVGVWILFQPMEMRGTLKG